MVRVNLFGEVKDNSIFHKLQLIAFGATVFAVMLICFLIQSSLSSTLHAGTEEKAELDQQLAKLAQKTKKVDELEQKKKTLGEKLTTIATLKSKKSAPVHVMDELTKAIPVRAWLTSIAQKEDSIELTGVAVDPQTVSEFMRKLEDSIYFEKVDLIFSKRGITNEVKLQEFSVLAHLTGAADLQKALGQAAAGAQKVVSEPTPAKPS